MATTSTHRLAVGTTNICKLKAVKSCQVKLAEHLSNYVISSHKVESGINDQPDSMSMTLRAHKIDVVCLGKMHRNSSSRLGLKLKHKSLLLVLKVDYFSQKRTDVVLMSVFVRLRTMERTSTKDSLALLRCMLKV